MPVNVMVTLRRALRQLEAQRARIDSQIAAIRSVLGAVNVSKGRSGGSTSPVSARRRRRMSSVARRALSQRMKAYWAKQRKGRSKAKTRSAETK